MINKIGKYALVFFVAVLATGCGATNNFEWVKVNPDKINLAKNRTPYSSDIRQVNLILNLQEKGQTFYYPESNGFFADEVNNTEFAMDKSSDPKNKTTRYWGNRKRTKAKASISTKKPVTNLIPASDADKLNAALKIPLNSKALKPGKNTASFGQTAAEIRQMAFNDIKKKNPEIEEKSAEKQQRGKNLMWAGLVLVVLGGIMGFVFGRSAFLISVAGVVFAAIGYFFRI